MTSLSVARKVSQVYAGGGTKESARLFIRCGFSARKAVRWASVGHGPKYIVARFRDVWVNALLMKYSTFVLL